MRRSLISIYLLLSGVVGAFAAVPAQKSWSADNGNGTYTNPLFYDEFSDPDIIRVGSDFYLVGTTMHSVPGVEIFHSTDLVNWEHVGYCFDRFDFPDHPEFSLKDGQNIYGQGIWAPCIRYNNGKFYIFYNINGIGKQVYMSEGIKGPWKHVKMDGDIYDLSVLFDDDGKVYAIHGYDRVLCTELKPDLSGPVEGSEREIIPAGNAMGEGHHVYKVDGMYYILSANYSPMGRMQCARSSSIYGPYETCVISALESFGYGNGLSTANISFGKEIPDDDFNFVISKSDPNRLGAATIHQGGIVQLENGEWWGWSMQDFHSVGRTTCLSPITWHDGWPFFGIEGNLGRSPRTWTKPDVSKPVAEPIAPFVRSDDFNGKSLNPVRQWNHNPDDKMWSLSGGQLRLKTMPAVNLMNARNSLTQRAIGPVSVATVTLDAKKLKVGDIAGLGIQNMPSAWIGVIKSSDGYTLNVYDQYTKKNHSVKLDGSKVYLRLTGDYDEGTSMFSYSLDGVNFQDLGETVLLPYQLRTFQGPRWMLFAYSTSGKNGGEAAFDDFTVVEPKADRTANLPIGKTITLRNLGSGNLMYALPHGMLHDVAPNDRHANKTLTQFRIIDRGNGQVSLQCADGRYMYIAGIGLSSDVRFTNDPEKAGKFMWQDMLNNQCMLLSMDTNRYLGKDVLNGAPYSADFTGADAARRNGSVFEWTVVEDNFNPIIPDMVADPSIVKFGDTYYLYGTTDISTGLGQAGVPVVWQSDDFVNWSFSGSHIEGIDWARSYTYTDKDGNSKEGYYRYWAPGKPVLRDGVYYLYVTIVKPDNTDRTYALTAQSPTGPFKVDINSLDSMMIAPDIDGEPFVDTNGDAYMFWRRRMAAKIAPDMKHLASDPVELKTNRSGYSEGPLMFKRDSIYYYVYTLSGHQDYVNAYMMSKESPLTGFVKPEGEDIFAYSSIANDVWGLGHGNVFNVGDNYYFTYLEYGDGGTTRQVFVNPLNFNADGTIVPLSPNRTGVGYLGKPTEVRTNMAAAATFIASSNLAPLTCEVTIETQPNAPLADKKSRKSASRTHNYIPSNVGDRNNGTRWMASKDDANPWITCDLGSVRKVEECKMYFDTPTQPHSWLLESSIDGKTWKEVAKNEDKQIRSPHMADVKTDARYLRLTILAGSPGLWEWQVY